MFRRRAGQVASASVLAMLSLALAYAACTRGWGEVRGRLTDAGGLSIAGGMLDARPLIPIAAPAGALPTSDPDGWYGVTLPSGPWSITARATGGLEGTAWTVVHRGGTATLDLVMIVRSSAP